MKLDAKAVSPGSAVSQPKAVTLHNRRDFPGAVHPIDHVPTESGYLVLTVLLDVATASKHEDANVRWVVRAP